MNGYTIILEQAESGSFGAWSPDLPGCAAVGDTRDECLTLMHEAIDLHLDGIAESGEPIPQPSAVGVELYHRAA